jgi:hypothetical protein
MGTYLGPAGALSGRGLKKVDSLEFDILTGGILGGKPTLECSTVIFVFLFVNIVRLRAP